MPLATTRKFKALEADHRSLSVVFTAGLLITVYGGSAGGCLRLHDDAVKRSDGNKPPTDEAHISDQPPRIDGRPIAAAVHAFEHIHGSCAGSENALIWFIELHAHHV